MVILYWGIVLLYLASVVIMMLEWKGWKEGFLEPDGRFTSKYYQIAFVIMRLGFVCTILGLAYILYWLGAYSQIF